MRKLPVLAERAILDAKVRRSSSGIDFRANVQEDMTCRKGCAHCCHWPVHISVFEGISLYRALKDSGLWGATMRQALEKHRGATAGLPVEVWMAAEIRCPLLSGSNTCLVYEDRPHVCQVTASLGNPDDCRPARFGVHSPLVPVADILQKNRLEVARLQKSVGVPDVVLRISSAVLLAEKVIEGAIDLEDINAEVLKDYLKESL